MGLFDSDHSNAPLLDALAKDRNMYGAIDLPTYKEYVPGLYSNQSANYELTKEDPVVKSKQLEALSKLSDLSSTGSSDADLAGFAKAREEGNQISRHGTEAALANAAQRGISGSGLEFAMRDSANQQAAQRAQEAAQQQASTAAQQRAQYLQTYAQGLGNVRGQDQQMNQANTNVINQFNATNTQNRNAMNNANVGQKNSAFMYNEGLKDKNYSNQMGRADRVAGMNNKEGDLLAAQQEADRKRQAAVGGAIGGAAGSYFGPAGAAAGSSIGSSIA